jgi:hypothetical protein
MVFYEPYIRGDPLMTSTLYGRERIAQMITNVDAGGRGRI